MQTTLQPCMAGPIQQHKWYGCPFPNLQAHRNVIDAMHISCISTPGTA